MYLKFETKVEDYTDLGIPVLLDSGNIMPDTIIDGLKIDDLSINIEDNIITAFHQAIARFNTETLRPKHFRDCTHFAMAMYGLWMPTHPPYDKDFFLELDCEYEIDTTEHYGPVALGIPNDSRCLGSGNDPFVYSHTVFGIDSSVGTLCLGKLGIFNEYSLSSFDAILAEQNLEISHPIKQLVVKMDSKEIFKWNMQYERV